ncbi:MAG: alanyl-tRNA editing protein [Oscillospiraceae bacterium]|nr:alanyl-tRNA editing protein [Oscillospiraceae bacterium]
MNTRQLYYEDSHLRQFTAAVTACAETDRGWEVTLDATAFYPEGGGQACDLGILGTAAVLDVRERGEDILHLCDSPLAVGTEVTGIIDWDRRFDQMQQHSGEHILSGLIHGELGWHNVGFHVGAEFLEVDFDGPISWDRAMDLERRVNEAVWQDLPIRCWYPTAEELPAVGYRTKKALPWPVRVVEVPGFDKCACCGVHVKRTGEIGIVKIISVQKFHQGTRLQMLCGKRAYGYLAAVYRQNQQVSQAFSAKPLETAAAAARMNEALNAEKFRAGGLEKRVFACIAESYANRGDTLRFEPGLSSAGVRDLADAIAAVCGGTAAVFSGEDGAYQVCLVNKGGDVKALGTAMNKALNGRGGGKPGYFQGSVKAARGEIENFFAARWE